MFIEASPDLQRLHLWRSGVQQHADFQMIHGSAGELGWGVAGDARRRRRLVVHIQQAATAAAAAAALGLMFVPDCGCRGCCVGVESPGQRTECSGRAASLRLLWLIRGGAARRFCPVAVHGIRVT